MRSRALLLVLATLLSLAVGSVPASAETAMTPSSLGVAPLYLALGDSVAYGVGAVVPPHGGYVARLHHRLLSELTCWPVRWPISIPSCFALWRDNHAVPGATTESVIRDQLPPVIAELESRNSDALPFNDVRVVTVTVGGNDVFGPVVAACAQPSAASCAPAVAAQLGQVAENLPVILNGLRAAAGQHTTIAIMTYYNPLASCHLSDLTALADVVLEGGPVAGDGTSPLGLNDIIRQSARDAGAVVAESYGRLSADDLVGGGDCLHPDGSGHAIIADAFADVILPG